MAMARLDVSWLKCRTSLMAIPKKDGKESLRGGRNGRKDRCTLRQQRSREPFRMKNTMATS